MDVFNLNDDQTPFNSGKDAFTYQQFNFSYIVVNHNDYI